MSTISAVIITFNEDSNIAECIDSVKPIADEIIVIDSLSTDGTAVICKEKGAIFKARKFINYSDQKNYGNALAQCDYVLSIDADERLSEALIQSILTIKNNMKFGGYTMNRLANYRGKWIKTCGWHPDVKLRIWKNLNGKWEGQGVHEKITLLQDQSIHHLKGDLLHYSYKEVKDFLEKTQHYSTIYAKDKQFKIRSSGFKIFYKTLFTFIKSYFLRMGILDGYEGLLISVSNASYTFFKYSKLKEANDTMTTSLVICTYNRERALAVVLESVLNLSEKPDEIIIADDGSGSATKSVIEKYVEKLPIPVKHCRQQDLGFRLSTIRNKAIAMAKGEYIIMIDGDIVMPRHFVQSHKKQAHKGKIIQGSRVFIGSKLTQRWLNFEIRTLSFFDRGIGNRLNRLYIPWLSNIFSFYSKRVTRVRGANLSFWKSDCIRVNGFNEKFVNWGREDSEFIARANHVGLSCKHLKLMGAGYHLYHEILPKKGLEKNEKILENTMLKKLSWCDKGINQYM